MGVREIALVDLMLWLLELWKWQRWARGSRPSGPVTIEGMSRELSHQMAPDFQLYGELLISNRLGDELTLLPAGP